MKYKHYTRSELLFKLSYLVAGVVLISMGTLWMTVDQPWMLDRVANEERLGITFSQLFSHSINSSLPGYLMQIYRFFGLWVVVIGLFNLTLGYLSDSKTREINISLLISNGFMVFGGMSLAVYWIPSSPFIFLGFGLIGIYLISIRSYLNFIRQI